MVKTSDHITGPNCSDKEPINFGIKFVAATASLESRKFLGQFWRVHNCSVCSDTPNRLRECGKDVAQPNSDGTNLVKVTCEKNRQDGKEGGSAIKVPRTPRNIWRQNLQCLHVEGDKNEGFGRKETGAKEN